MSREKPRRGNRGQSHRDEVARRQAAQRRDRQAPAPAARTGRSRAAPAATPGRPGVSRRAGLGGDQVEGRRAVRELLFARRRRVHDVWISESAEESPVLAEIVDLATEARVPVRRVARGRLEAEARTDAPQGVLAHAEQLPEADLERLAERRPGEPAPFLLALDGITDPQNVGALLRTAESAGASGVVLPRHRAAHITPAAAKAAAGAIEWLPMALVPGLPNALARLRDLGVWVVGLDADAETRLFDLPVADQPVALVLGAEGSGLARLTRTRCDVLVSIPQRGQLSSLNVAAAGALACFEIARHRED